MTRSLSNLIKSVYFNMEPGKVTAIDSDENVEQYIPNILELGRVEEAKPFHFDALDGSLPEENEEAEFESGLSVISMDDVIGEEREKLSAQMNEERENILDEARQEAEAIVARANEQAEAIKEMARSEGKAIGMEEGRNEAGIELDQMRQGLQQEFQEKMMELEEQERNLEPAFAEIVVSLVKKLTGIVCEDKKEVILYLIGNALRNMEKTSKLVLRVSKKDIALVSAKKSTLKVLAKDVMEFDILEDESLTESQCIIETDNRIIDCSLDAQMQNLEEHVKLLVY